MDSPGSSPTLCEAAKEILNRSLTNRLQNARLGHLAVEITLMTRAWCLVDVPVVPAFHPVQAIKKVNSRTDASAEATAARPSAN